MSQLQIGLITLGALIILAVLLFNWWQERDIKREMYRRFEGPIDDVLMAEIKAKASVEPIEEFHIDTDAVIEIREELVFETSAPEKTGGQDEKMEHTPPQDAVAIETPQASVAEAEPEIEAPRFTEQVQAPEPLPAPEIAAPATEPEKTPATASAFTLPPEVDLQIDEVAVVSMTVAYSGLTLRDALHPLPNFQKPMRWLGVTAAGEVMPLTKENEDVQFLRVVAALQLADRSGPASGEDLRNFHAKVEDLVARLGGALEWHEHGDPLQYARELDQFCIDVDVMITLQLAAGNGGPFAGTKLRGVAEASGGNLKEDGQFHFADSSGSTLFTLISLDRKPMNAESLRSGMMMGVVLMLDLPRVANGNEVFNQMVLAGRKLETALGSRLTDENQRALGDAEIDKIRQQLKVLHSKMLARGVVPGSPSALRLFS